MNLVETAPAVPPASWQGFDEAWYRLAHPAVRRMLAGSGASTAEAVFRAIGRVFMHSPNPYFDEKWYQSRYPAVRQDIAAGTFASGFEHYRREGRPALSPHWLFDPEYYRRQWRGRHGEALPEEIQADPYGHFLAHGQHEGLSGHWLFDPATYAAAASYDIARRIAAEGAFTTLLHQIAAGEDPVTSPAFDPSWYRVRYPEAERHIARGECLCALHHYLTNDDPASFDPSPRFCEQSYTAWHFDVTAAIRSGSWRNGLEHFLRAGRAEGRFFTAADRADAGCVTARFPLRVRPAEGFSIREPAIAERGGTYVLGGTLHARFGPCLVQSLARLWYLRQHTEHPVIWHMDPALPPPHAWPGWLQDLWHLLGLDRRDHVFVSEPARFQRVLVPDPGIGAGGIIHEAQIEALAAHQSHAPADGSRVWLSRSHAAPTEAEGHVERLLAERGWTVRQPETLALAGRIDLFSQAAFVSGYLGAPFLTMLLSVNPGAMLLPVLRPGIDVALFDAAASGKGVLQSFIRPRLRDGAKPDLADPAGLADAVCQIADEAAREVRLGRVGG